MSSRASDLRICESANHFRPPSRANFKGPRNTEIILYTGGNRFAESQIRNGLALERPKRGLRSGCAESALGPSRHGSFRAVRFPEARGNNSEYRQSLLRLSGRPPKSRRAALGAAVGDAGRRVGTSLPPGRVSRERPRRRQIGRWGREAVFAGGMRW